ncbi:hypothetical protein B0I37DRAFT_202571 [Chaetomium sp. MPI-CAGE-AT-0009]|nr:hypothetical protein B0I37DRAFT_202571 [Chaetomium sp. MPI-CAGE-AT-0009]
MHSSSSGTQRRGSISSTTRAISSRSPRCLWPPARPKTFLFVSPFLLLLNLAFVFVFCLLSLAFRSVFLFLAFVFVFCFWLLDLSFVCLLFLTLRSVFLFWLLDLSFFFVFCFWLLYPSFLFGFCFCLVTCFDIFQRVSAIDTPRAGPFFYTVDPFLPLGTSGLPTKSQPDTYRKSLT